MRRTSKVPSYLYSSGGILAVLTIAFAPVSLESKILSAFLVCIYCFVALFMHRMVERDKVFLPIYFITCAYLSVAYVLKFALILHEPKLVWGYEAVFANDWVIIDNIQKQFVFLAPALMLFLIGFAAGPRFRPDSKPNIRHNGPLVSLLFLLGIVLLVLKLLCQVFFNIGSPVHVGTGLPAPLVALLEFVVQDSMIVWLNVIYFYFMVWGKRRAAQYFTVCLLFNMMLSLSAGWKGEMMVQFFLFAYYLYFFRQQKEGHIRKKNLSLYVLIAMMGISIAYVYPYVNLYRFSLIERGDVAASIAQARQFSALKAGEQDSAAVLVFDRITGINKFYPAAVLGEAGRFPVSTLLDNGLSGLMKWGLYGERAEDVRSGIGTSQFAGYYLVFGIPGLLILSMVLGIAIRLFFFIFFTYIMRYRETLVGYVPLASHFTITLLMTGGNISYVAKSAFVTIFGLFVLERFVAANEVSVKRKLFSPQGVVDAN